MAARRRLHSDVESRAQKHARRAHHRIPASAKARPRLRHVACHSLGQRKTRTADPRATARCIAASANVQSRCSSSHGRATAAHLDQPGGCAEGTWPRPCPRSRSRSRARSRPQRLCSTAASRPLLRTPTSCTLRPRAVGQSWIACWRFEPSQLPAARGLGCGGLATNHAPTRRRRRHLRPLRTSTVAHEHPCPGGRY
jgi:hypothetical protein